MVGGGTPSTKIANFWQGNIPWISSSDLVENNIYKINITRHISEDAVKHSSTKLISPKSILVVTRVGLGKIAVAEKTLCTSQDFTSLFSQNVNPYYFAYLIQKTINNEKSQGSTIKGISSYEIAKKTLSYPLIDEQNKVFKFINAIDRKIGIVEDKLSTLKKYKKGLQQRLFLRQNSLEYLRLKEIVKFMPKSKLSAGLSISNGKYPFFLSGDKTGKINDFLYEGIYVIANDGGEAGFRTTQNKFAYSDHCICFKAQTDYVTKNVYEYLDLIKAQITYIGFTGSGLKNIDRNYFENIKIPKIVLQPIHAFNLFNSLIERLNLKLTNLKLMKKYLLRNLFI